MAAEMHTREGGFLINEFLPNPDFIALYRIGIHASPSAVYQALLNTNFNDVWLVRLLMMIRSGKCQSRKAPPGGLHERFRGTGFVVLAETPKEELVIGVTGKFWRLDGGRCTDLRADSFQSFSRPEFAKAAWNFRLCGDSPHRTTLSTETRIKCFGRGAWWKFRLYWTLVAPFSGLIRKAILRRVKVEAESNPSA